MVGNKVLGRKPDIAPILIFFELTIFSETTDIFLSFFVVNKNIAK